MATARKQQNPGALSRILVTAGMALLALALSAPGPAGAQGKKPITRKGLLEAVQINGLTTKELVARIEQRGVDFELTPADESEFRRAGARPEIISAVRASYRPAAPSVAARPATSSPPAANTQPAGGPRLGAVPDGPPLGKNEIVTLLQSGVGAARVEQFVEKRGVSFAVTPEIAREITAAGGTRSLVGAITEKSTSEEPATTTASISGPDETRDEGPDYDDLTDRALASMKASDPDGAVRLLQQAVSLDPSKSTAYQLLGINMLYAQQNFGAAEQAMRAALERDGAAVFRVYHDHDGAFNTYCEGSFFVTKTGVSFRADDGQDTFEAEDSNIKEAKTNAFVGASVGAFHIKPKVKINGRDNFNFAPATRQKAEAKLLISMIQSF